MVGEVNSRWVLGCVYKWYKVLSPRVVVGVDGVGKFSPELLLAGRRKGYAVGTGIRKRAIIQESMGLNCVM